MSLPAFRQLQHYLFGFDRGSAPKALIPPNDHSPLNDLNPKIVLNNIVPALASVDRGNLRQASAAMSGVVPLGEHLRMCVDQKASARNKAAGIFQNANLASVHPENRTVDEQKVHYVNFAIKNDAGSMVYKLNVSCYAVSPDAAMTIAKDAIKNIFESATELSLRKKALLETFGHTNFHDLNNSSDFRITRMSNRLTDAVLDNSVEIDVLQFDDESATYHGRRMGQEDVGLSLFQPGRKEAIAEHGLRVGVEPQQAIRERTNNLVERVSNTNLQEAQALVDQSIEQLRNEFRQNRDPIYLRNVFDREIGSLMDAEVGLEWDRMTGYYSHTLTPESTRMIKGFFDAIWDARADVKDHPQRFGITDLMQSACRVFNQAFGNPVRDKVNQEIETVERLLSDGADPAQVDAFGRNAYHYIAEGATVGTRFPGRSRMLDTLKNNDPHFDRNVMARDHMGKSAVDFLMEGHNDNEFLSPDQLSALTHAQNTEGAHENPLM